MKKTLLLLPIAFLLAGCLQLEQTIALKRDGSAVVSMTYAIPEQHVPTMTAAQQAIAAWQNREKDANWFLDRQAVKDFFDKPEHGVSLLLYKQYRKNDLLCAEIVVQAKEAAKAFEQGYFGQITLEKDTLTIRIPKDLDELPRQQMQELRTLCGDMTLSIEVITPRNLTETNGLKRGGDRAFWKLSADGRGMDVFGKLDDFMVRW